MYYCEVGLEDGELVTTGIYGWVMVVTGVGATISWRGPIVWRSCNPYEGVWDLLQKPEQTRKLVSVEDR